LLLASEELPWILQRWFKPLRTMKEGKGRWPDWPVGARETLYQFVLECITDKVDREMKALAFLFTSLSEEFSGADLLDIDFEKRLKPKVHWQFESYAPILWQSLIEHYCYVQHVRTKEAIFFSSECHRVTRPYPCGISSLIWSPVVGRSRVHLIHFLVM
jgi:hypothetical protein